MPYPVEFLSNLDNEFHGWWTRRTTPGAKGHNWSDTYHGICGAFPSAKYASRVPNIKQSAVAGRQARALQGAFYVRVHPIPLIVTNETRFLKSI